MRHHKGDSFGQVSKLAQNKMVKNEIIGTYKDMEESSQVYNSKFSEE